MQKKGNINAEKIMIIDQKRYSVNKNMLLIAYRIDEERFGELRSIISEHYTIYDVTYEDEIIPLLEVNLGNVIAVMFNAELILDRKFRLIERLNDNKRFVMIPVLAAAYENNEDICVKCMEAGANEYFVPPFNRNVIPLRLNNAVRAKDSVTFHEMEMMLRELPSNIYLKDADGRYIFSAHYWHHLRASEPGWTIRGKSEFDIQKDPAIAKKSYEADRKMIETKKGTSYILDLNTDGIREFIQVNKSPTYDADGNVNGIIAIMTDVTELEMLKRKLEDRTEALSAELKVAAQIQSSMMPHDMACHELYEVSASMTPAKNVGGDYYDFFPMDDDHVAFTIADVSGKGVPAALTMTITKIVIHDRALVGGTPAEILFDANERICMNNKMERFITVWFGILDLKTGTITYASAGHEYPAVKRKNGKYELVVSENCPPVGTVTGIEYYDQTIDLSGGGSIFLYTDGVTDVKNSSGTRFGINHTLELLNNVTSFSAEETVEYIKNEIDTFVGDTDRFDDTTMMCIKYKG